MTLEEDLIQKLGTLNISFEREDHDAAKDMVAMQQVLQHREGVKAKNFLSHDKKKNQTVLLMLRAETDMNLVHKALGRLKGWKDLRRAETELVKKLGLEKGALTPFAVMNDADNKVPLYVEDSLKAQDKIWIHPFRNTASLCLSMADIQRFAEEHGHNVNFFNPEPPAAPTADGVAANGGGGGGKKAATSAAAAPGQESTLGMTATKDGNYPEWFQQVCRGAELIEYTDVSGCYVIRARATYVWKRVQRFFTDLIEEKGVVEELYPMFVSSAALHKEAHHLEGFAPEVAWLGSTGPEPFDPEKPDGKGKPLKECIALRPTSETIMYPQWAKWVRSHRDLPIKINQWCNVVRWEFKQPTPFIRTREFYWQEGHTAHATDKEAEDWMWMILDFYRRVYEELLAVPVVPGVKSEGEKFPGGKITSTVEAYMPNGRAVQAATSHHLGDNFSKIYEIVFDAADGVTRSFVHQTSWGLTTRSVGVAVMVHSDDKGLVLPPKVAMGQVVLIPIPYQSKSGENPAEAAKRNEEIRDKCERLAAELKRADYFEGDSNKYWKIRAYADTRQDKTPGWKYNEWELKGVPVRIELGPKDYDKQEVVLVRRDTGEKIKGVKWTDLTARVPALLREIQDNLFVQAKKKLDDAIVKVTKWEEVTPALNQRKIVLAPWCQEEETEDEIKKRTTEEAAQTLANEQATQPAAAAAAAAGEGEEEYAAPALTGAAKPLCILTDDDPRRPPLTEDTKCFLTGKAARCWALFGRSY
ncbi:unnamed protein product [Vitrella brassicaformis CCMP3155]|uniref:Proline--tRNA ligase n=2 Tax=Vitrella brassicaformis TaxID=1169539 RepID=A0A0G4GEJ1_VITBC|nr:unnamed protein product [Vitrella brassicaformis CCMP3155]|eukprot:CEM27581.1 unnamed protein product [Vitrella brassicaformis CCMP3155]